MGNKEDYCGDSSPNRKNFGAPDNPKKHKRKTKAIFWTRVFIIFFLVPLTLFIVIKGCVNTKNTPISPGRTYSHDKYDILITNWNRYVNQTDLGNSFYLQKSSPEDTVRKLNIILEPFFRKITAETQAEFKMIELADKNSLFRFYHDFLIKYTGQEQIKLSTEDSSLEIKSIIYRLTKRDDLDKKTLKIVGSLHSVCTYLDAYQSELYEKGMGRWISYCSDVQVDKTKYPNLNSLLSSNHNF
jgi:hypothetical protein